MDKHLEIIWQYIDGTLSPSEVVSFEKRLESETELNRLYVSQLQLHQSLTTHNVVSAPSNFASQVMSKLQSQSMAFDLKKFDSFAGIKSIMFWALGVTILGLVFIFFFPPIATTATASTNAIISVDKFIPDFLQNFTLSNEMIKYSSYTMILLLVPVLVALDNFLNKRRAIG